MTTATTPNLTTELSPKGDGGLTLNNPVIAASGTFGYGTELADSVDIQRLGAIVCKGVTRYPRDGNPQPRLVETTAGLLNTIGLQNIGVDAIVAEKAPIWAQWQVPVIVNVAGDTVEEYGIISKMLDGVDGVSGLEANIGCPNVEVGGLEFGIDPRSAAAVTEAMRSASSFPLMVKLTPNVTDIVEIARAVVGAGADSISLVNTYVGMSIDVGRRKPGLGTVMGGFSGPAIKPIALAMVYKVAEAVDVPVVGIGGISSAGDALEYLMAGASAVQVGTANFLNPNLSLDIIDEIGRFLKSQNIGSLSDIIGAAHVDH